MQATRAANTDQPASRYVVGIDLGTTNSAVAYVDTHERLWQTRTLSIPQIVAPAQIESRETLPSFHYEPASGELAPGALQLPWNEEEPKYAVGFFARDQGTFVPGRLIASAKSWLCHSGVDRTADLLPWHGAPDVTRHSPVDVSARYLAHVRDAWNARFPSDPLSAQEIVLTLPASFDEVARELTVRAAAQADLPRVVLIEEPQAAFYAWIDAHSDDWHERVSPGQKILICDIGGGTSDFTLIRVRRGADDKVQFHRVAVGEHLILGGDNLDLALAHSIEQRLPNDEKLDPRQWAMLVRQCRQVKETLLGPDPPSAVNVPVGGGGSRLIGGSRQVEVTREAAHEVLVEGFFPQVELEAKPLRRRSGFQEFGLPYAADAAITRYLAAFLTAHRNVALDDVEPAATHDPARPDIVLFNGGLFASPVLRERLLDALRGWFRSADEHWEPLVLDNERLGLAVARGAAYYGLVRRGEGVRIAAGLARTYYIGVESQPPSAICLVPASAEAGQDIDLSQRQFDLLVSQPVEFPLYVSSTRLTDRPGELVPFDREQMTPLPPIRTVLRTNRKSETDRVATQLHARLTEIGTLDLWCSEIDGGRHWRLQFDVRSTTQTDLAAHAGVAEQEGFIDEATWEACYLELQRTFGPAPDAAPADLMKRLAQAIGQERQQWPSSLLRRLWEALVELESGRRRSRTHESRWLNLLGFALRPGYGLAVDDWRVAQTWRLVQGKLAHPACRAESWILWRRIGGGLTAGQQQALADPVLGPLRTMHRRLSTGKGRGGDVSFRPEESAEIWRLLGSLELLPTDLKIELGGAILDLFGKRKTQPVQPALAWALGRLGARVPLYGPLNTVVPADMVSTWLERFREFEYGEPMGLLAVMQLARRTDDRYRDLPDATREATVRWLNQQQAAEHFVELVRAGGVLDEEEQDRVFGESLPHGLRLV